MIKVFVKAWDANQNKLKEHFHTHKMEEYDAYKKLVLLLFGIVINPYLERTGRRIFNLDLVHEIDDGKCHGTLLYVIPRVNPDPTERDYVLTNISYGSCPLCDWLEEIQTNQDTNHDYLIPTEEQVSEHMTLCLHLLQKCIIPYGAEDDDDKEPCFQ